MSDTSGTTIIGLNRPDTPKTRWFLRFKQFVSNPAVAAALGSFLAFSATQAAEYFQASRSENSAVMLAELEDGRAATVNIVRPKTSQEASEIIKTLQVQSVAFRTEQAQTLMQNTIATYDTIRAEFAQSELAAKEAQEASDRAAKAAADQAQNEALRLEAERAAQAAAAAQKAVNDTVNAVQSIDRGNFRLDRLRF